MDNEYPDETPAFVLSVFDDGLSELELIANIPENPVIENHASLGLLFGLAVLTLDRQGTINSMVDMLLAEGPINEVDASNRIIALMEEKTNVAN